MKSIFKGIVTFFRAIAPVLVLAGAGAIVAGLFANKPEVEKSEDNRQIAALTVAPARAETVTVTVGSQGEVRAKTDVQIVPEVAGRITYVNDAFAEGGVFTANTVLAKIDDSSYKLAVIRAEARVAEARLNLEQQLADARIKEKQWKDYGLDGEPTALALNKPQVAEAQARLRSAVADMDEAKLNLDRTEIKMPFNGRVSERTVGLGQFVATGTSLGRAFATDVVEVRLPLTDRQIGELDIPLQFDMASGGINMPVTLRATMAGKEREWSAKLVRMQASLDAQTRLYYAIAEVENPYAPAPGKAPLPVGLFVSAEISGPQEKDAIVIPRTALRGDNRVFTIVDDTLKITEVSVLSTNADEAIILAGVEAGANVVISPVRSPADGMTVRIANTDVASADDKTSDATAAISAAAGAQTASR